MLWYTIPAHNFGNKHMIANRPAVKIQTIIIIIIHKQL